MAAGEKQSVRESPRVGEISVYTDTAMNLQIKALILQV